MHIKRFVTILGTPLHSCFFQGCESQNIFANDPHTITKCVFQTWLESIQFFQEAWRKRLNLCYKGGSWSQCLFCMWMLQYLGEKHCVSNQTHNFMNTKYKQLLMTGKPWNAKWVWLTFLWKHLSIILTG